jgi:hypothetical protein
LSAAALDGARQGSLVALGLGDVSRLGVDEGLVEKTE